jgi:hypothetical protein
MMTNLMDRVIRVLKLESQVYEEIEADASAAATWQAAIVVILSSMAGGFGFIYRFGLNGIFTGIVMTLAGWLVWAYLTYLIGTKVLPETETRADLGQLLRSLGFASSPGFIRVLGFIPLLGNFITLVSTIWMLIAMIIATRQALDYTSTTRAITVCVIGWIINWLVYLFFFLLFS